jgi:hypothetical protein
MHADSQDPNSREFHIVGNLSTDDPHWRGVTVASALLGSATALWARRTSGPARLILTVLAAVLSLPALSLASMIGLALLLQRLERKHRDDARGRAT